MTATQTGARTGVKDVWALAVLIGIGVSIPLYLAAASGSIGLPHNDDWVYMRAADSLYRTGTFDLLAHTAAFVGQLVTVQPLLWLSSGDPWAFTAYGLLMASVAVAATYLLARCFLGIGSSVLVALTVLVIPGFARQSASFMTDGPALALGMVCLLFGTKWLQGDTRPVTLIASLGTGLVAITIREFAVAAPVAILTVAWVRSRPNQRSGLTLLSGVLAIWVLCVIFLASIPSNNVQPMPPNTHSLSALGPAFITLAAVVLPVAVLAIGPQIATFNPKLILLSAGLVGFMVGLARNGPLIGNLWTSSGLGGDFFLMGSRDSIFGMTAWNLSEEIATFAAILVAALVLRWGQSLFGVISFSAGRGVAMRIARAPDLHLLLFLFLYAAGLVVYSSIAPLYDRYLYPMVPVFSIFLLRRASGPAGLGRSHAFAHGALAWLALSAFIIAINSFAYDAARHADGEAAVSMGYDAATVDAGYEWVGYHGVGPERPFSNPLSVNWWEANWPTFRPCAILSNSPVDIPAYKLIRVNQAAYNRFLLFGPAEPLYLYGALMDGCPAPPSA